MGTTLTGTTPQDTYDSLIKVTDNGPLSGTAKYLSDGLGNDSALAVSTTAVGIGTASPTAGSKLTLLGTSSSAYIARIVQTNTTNSDSFGLFIAAGTDNSDSAFRVQNAAQGANLFSVQGGGNVGIGTSAPADKLTVKGVVKLLNDEVAAGYSTLDIVPATAIGASANRIAALNTTDIAFETSAAERFRITNNGVTFNGDTAAANALDDYEEGTFTLTFAGNSVAGTYTPTAVNATYTKIGRVVTLQYKATFAGGASGGSGYMQITGLPFNYAADSGGLTGTLILSDASWGGSYLSMIPVTSGSSNQIIINETSPSTGLTNFVQASDFNTSTDIRFTLTYQV